MFVNLGFASADNYMWSETFLILLAMGRNKLFRFFDILLYFFLTDFILSDQANKNMGR